MGHIIVLDENTTNKIAAGEVIEKPASVVKELVENSIDANSSSIHIDIEKGGIALIRVIDNGDGIEHDDVEMAFERHATSKITGSENLDNIKTLGFRGEALASIASVSKVRLATKTRGGDFGMEAVIEGGNIKSVQKTGCREGTSISVRELFYNTPARYKFLKQDATEARYITDMVNRIAIGNPHISFRVTSKGAGILHTPGNNDLLSAIYSLYGKEIAANCIQIESEDSNIKIRGYIGNSAIARASRKNQTFFVNSRYIKSSLIASALAEAYRNYLIKGKFPFAVLFIDVPPQIVDVNVHPTKIDVRFANEQNVFRAIYHCVRQALSKGVSLTQESHEGIAEPLLNYSQPEIGGREDNLKKPSDGKTNPDAPNYKADLKYDKNSKLPGFDIENKTYLKTNDNKDKPAYPKEAEDKKNMFSGSIFLGQLFNTYILIEQGEKLLLVDQHAAHERIIYDKLKKNMNNMENFNQSLIPPVVIEINPAEIGLINENKELFEQLGFRYEKFGNNSILLRSVPYDRKVKDIKEEFTKLIDAFFEIHNKKYEEILNETLYRIACTNAIKAGKVMGAPEVESLLQRLSKTDNPLTCPHGRPVTVKINKLEIEKMFKRKL